MSLISSIINTLPRTTAGSEETSRAVMTLCGKITPKTALFIGDDFFTPELIRTETGADVIACFTEQLRAEHASEIGITARTVMPFEIPADEKGEFIWYNGVSSLEGSTQLLDMIYGALESKQTAVFRTLCWLIEPSPDTKCYVERRFGKPEALDAVVRNARDAHFRVRDFYIAPRNDWIHGLYDPLRSAIKKLEGTAEDGEETGISEFNKEMYMFDLHSEEYSFVYYILEK